MTRRSVKAMANIVASFFGVGGIYQAVQSDRNDMWKLDVEERLTGLERALLIAMQSDRNDMWKLEGRFTELESNVLTVAGLALSKLPEDIDWDKTVESIDREKINQILDIVRSPNKKR